MKRSRDQENVLQMHSAALYVLKSIRVSNPGNVDIQNDSTRCPTKSSKFREQGNSWELSGKRFPSLFESQNGGRCRRRFEKVRQVPGVLRTWSSVGQQDDVAFPA